MARRRVVMTALATLAVASAAGPRTIRQSPLFVRGGRTTQTAAASAARRAAPASASHHADVQRDAATADDAPASAEDAPAALGVPLAVRRRRALVAGLPTGGGAEGRSLAPIIAISFLYFMTIATTAPALPTFCNQLKSATGGTDVNVAGNSLYGTMTAIDQFFTFCFVGIWGASASPRAPTHPTPSAPPPSLKRPFSGRASHRRTSRVASTQPAPPPPALFPNRHGR